MARGLVWSPEAIEDIEAIASYIERDSAWYERVAASKIVKTTEAIPPYSRLVARRGAFDHHRPFFAPAPAGSCTYGAE
jgi:plasmid stabilization system protein ParE